MNRATTILSEEEKKSYREELEDLALIRPLEENAKIEALEAIEILSAKNNETIFQPGDPAQELYIVLDGRIKIIDYSADGKQLIYYIYGPTDFVGGLNVLEDSPYLYTGQALEPTIVAVLPRAIFEKHMLTNINCLQELLLKSFERIRWAEDLAHRLASSNANHKVAALLLSLQESFGIMTREGVRLELTINREEMGFYSGLTRETTTRKLSEFKAAGILEFVGDKVIIIKDMEALKDLANQ